ncbi:hypothetical protein G6F59_017800 [Rhizopus arrhizus]|nr:hypothetical protein G6F59_017800 [Rhizopus arrhizus]
METGGRQPGAIARRHPVAALDRPAGSTAPAPLGRPGASAFECARHRGMRDRVRPGARPSPASGARGRSRRHPPRLRHVRIGAFALRRPPRGGVAQFRGRQRRVRGPGRARTVQRRAGCRSAASG